MKVGADKIITTYFHKRSDARLTPIIIIVAFGTTEVIPSNFDMVS